MLLSARSIRGRVRGIEEMPLISPMTDESIEFIEGSAPNLAVDKVFVPSPDGPKPRIGRHIRVVPPVVEVQPAADGWWDLQPGYYILQAAETVTVPQRLAAIIYARSTWFRCGALVGCSVAHPAFSGQLIVGTHVLNPKGIDLERGAPIVFLHFPEFDSMYTDPYRGVYGDDKIHTDGKPERGY